MTEPTSDDTLDWGGEEPKTRVLDGERFREPVTLLGSRAPVCAEEPETVTAAIERMAKHGIGCVLVVREGRLVGIFSERDVLIRVLAGGLDPARITVGEVMTPDPESLPLDAEIAWAVNRMSIGGFRHVPLVDEEDQPVGILSVKDVVDYIADFFPTEVMNIPPRPGLDVPRSREGG
jgi:CBS domain-containing protein